MTQKEMIKKQYGSCSSRLIDKECKTIDELKAKLENGLVLHESKNSLSNYKLGLIKILIVGTMIPDDLFYFYFGENNYIYSWIDEKRGSDFNKRKEKIMRLVKLGKEKEAKAELVLFINKLTEEKIAFVDLFDITVHKENSSADRDIRYYSIDHALFNTIKEDKNLKIVAVSRLAECMLKEKLNIRKDVEYHQLFNGGSKAPYMALFERK